MCVCVHDVCQSCGWLVLNGCQQPRGGVIVCVCARVCQHACMFGLVCVCVFACVCVYAGLCVFVYVCAWLRVWVGASGCVSAGVCVGTRATVFECNEDGDCQISGA